MEENTDKTVEIDQLERLLASYDDVPIEIRPNGEIRIKGTPSILKPITLRANLGGEYSEPRRQWPTPSDVFNRYRNGRELAL